MTASATSCTASSWPITRSCRTSSSRSSFSRSPSISGDRDAGPARHDLGDLVLGDLLAQQPLPPCLDEALLLGRCSRAPARQLAVAQLGRAVEVVVALGLLDLAPDLLELLAQRLQLADRLALGLPLGASSRRPRRAGRRAPCRSASSRSRLAASVSFCSAASSISSRMTRRVISSSSCGIESISVRITAHASSTRSIALSGRKRSVM